MQILSTDMGVRVNVHGRPRTKGSLEPVHVKLGQGRCRVSLTESGEYSVPWKKTMISGIKSVCVVDRFRDPVIVDMFARFDRQCLADDDLTWPTRRTGIHAHGDEDKLRRNVLDALEQSGLIRDDALVVGGLSVKRWTLAGESCGIVIKVRAAHAGDLEAMLAEEGAR